MNFKIIYISSEKNINIEILVNNYIKKIKYLAEINLFKIHNKNKSKNKKFNIDYESNLIINQLSKNDINILLDEKGDVYETIKFSKFIQKKFIYTSKKIVFIIGGAYGFNEELNKTIEKKISLSKFTYTHDMARLLLIEQIYRALTIIKNIPYHNQ
jgi:23S rRNA (pseudouridine1915-N3)-methyltransferase